MTSVSTGFSKKRNRYLKTETNNNEKKYPKVAKIDEYACSSNDIYQADEPLHIYIKPKISIYYPDYKYGPNRIYPNKVKAKKDDNDDKGSADSTDLGDISEVKHKKRVDHEQSIEELASDPVEMEDGSKTKEQKNNSRGT